MRCKTNIEGLIKQEKEEILQSKFCFGKWVQMYTSQNSRDRTLLGAFFFGFGLIAMVDGILFHQLLQWHSTYMWNPSKSVQIFSDGVLHVIATVFIVIGTVILWNSNPSAAPAKNTMLWSGLLLGGGAFNLLDGVLSHHLLGIHHVKPGDPNQLTYDLIFDLSAILMLWIGWLLYRRALRLVQS